MEGSEGVWQSLAAGVGGRFRENTVEVLEADVEDVLWVRLGHEEEESLVLAACYIPSESFSRGRGRGNLPIAGRSGVEV